MKAKRLDEANTLTSVNDSDGSNADIGGEDGDVLLFTNVSKTLVNLMSIRLFQNHSYEDLRVFNFLHSNVEICKLRHCYIYRERVKRRVSVDAL